MIYKVRFTLNKIFLYLIKIEFPTHSEYETIYLYR